MTVRSPEWTSTRDERSSHPTRAALTVSRGATWTRAAIRSRRLLATTQATRPSPRHETSRQTGEHAEHRGVHSGSDHETDVHHYVLEVFPGGANPTVANSVLTVIWGSRRSPKVNAEWISPRRSSGFVARCTTSPRSQRLAAAEALRAPPHRNLRDEAVDAPFGHREHTVCTTAHELFVVTGDEKGATAIGQLPQDGGEIASTRRVERCCGFIHQQHLRSHRQRTSDRDTLRFAS